MKDVSFFWLKEHYFHQKSISLETYKLRAKAGNWSCEVGLEAQNLHLIVFVIVSKGVHYFFVRRNFYYTLGFKAVEDWSSSLYSSDESYSTARSSSLKIVWKILWEFNRYFRFLSWLEAFSHWFRTLLWFHRLLWPLLRSQTK